MSGASSAKGEPQRELVLGVSTLAIATAYYLLAIRIPQSDIADVIGAQGLPRAYATLLAGLSIVLIVRAVLARRKAVALEARQTPTPAALETRPASVPAGIERGVAWRIVGMLMNGVIYVAVVAWLGYVLSITALIAATIYFQGGGVNRRTAAVALGGAICLWVLFVRILHIPHPTGIWPSLPF